MAPPRSELPCLQDVRAAISGHMQQLTAVVTKDAHQTAELAVQGFAGLSQQLGAKMEEINAAEEQHRAQQEGRLQEYRELYERTEPMKQVNQAAPTVLVCSHHAEACQQVSCLPMPLMPLGTSPLTAANTLDCVACSSVMSFSGVTIECGLVT